MKLIISALFLAMLFSCGSKKEEGISTDLVNNSASAENGGNEDLPDMKFEEEVFDFGRITQGEKVSHAFVFTNTGKSNLVITNASGSCGCTVPEYPKIPFAPGKQGKIDVVFNSEGKKGQQEKTVTVVTNCEPATKVIRIKADVIVAETAK
jgi:hypothetical protein